MWLRLRLAVPLLDGPGVDDPNKAPAGSLADGENLMCIKLARGGCCDAVHHRRKEPTLHSIHTFIAAVLLSMAPLSQSATADEDHAAHHPAGASAPAKAAATPASTTQATMKSMREMHDKMMAAKTSEERQALMADHMKAMQDGMAMMGQMKAGQASSAEAMGRRMDMMEMMMQMMMDREAARAPAGK
jgi:hypothetical protein